MNRKITIILALLILAIVSVSIAAAVNDTSDSAAASDGSDDAISENGDDAVDGDKLAADDDDKLDGPSDGGPAEFTIKKVWDDDNDKAGKRPKSVTVSAIVDGDTRGPFELSEENGWQATVVDVAGATSIEIREEAVDGYTTNVTGSPEEGYTITNTLKDQGQNATDTTDSDDTTGSDDKSVSDDVDPDGNKDPEVKQTTTITKTTTKEVPAKKEAKKAEPKKTKDKHNTGNPVLLGVLAISAAGLAYSLRRRE